MKVLIAIPALNEEAVLAGSVDAIQSFVASRLPQHEFVTVIVDNGSDDRTEEVGRALQARHPGVRYLRLGQRGKGLAIRSGWAAEQADVFVFMDADLSTDLEALPGLIAAIRDGADVAVGSRFHARSKVSRTPARKALSAGYRLLLKGVFGTSVADVPCGFKAVSATVAREMVPKVKDKSWFFDTELVIRCEKAGYRIHEVPVVWRDDRPAGSKSKVAVAKLVAEYLRQCLRLRNELREAGEGRSGGGAERRWVFGIAAGIMAATAIPLLYGLWRARATGMEFVGTQFLSPGDTAFYLSYIEQAERGRWLFENRFTLEKMTPVLNVFWLAVGIMGRILSLSPLAAYHIFRLALIPVFAGTAYLFISRIYADTVRRLWSFGLFMLGSGLGLYYSVFFAPLSAGGRYDWPIDLWVGESNAFLSMLYSPHFIASWTLYLLAFHLLLRAFESGRTRYAAWGGLSALVLLQFHPFHAPVLYLVPFVFLAVSALRRRLRRDMVASFFVFAAFSFPAVLYHLAVLRDPLWQAISANNDTPTPAAIHLLVGFGLFSVLWVFGYRQLRREKAGYADFLLVWVVVQALLVYAPFLFQRRMLEGLQFPLVMLSVPAVISGFRRVQARFGGGKGTAVVLAVLLTYVLFLPSTVGAIARSIEAYRRNQPPIFFWTPARSAALAWLRTRTASDAAVLSAADTGNGIVGWAYRRVYAGHWAGTPLIGQKVQRLEAFYGPTDADRIAFLRENGIDYVYWGPEERAYGGDISAHEFLVPVFEQGTITIFAVKK